MELKELKTLVAKGEGQYIEFKKNANEPDQVAEEVVGFANSKGGYLFVGVSNSGDFLAIFNSVIVPLSIKYIPTY